MTSKCEFPTHEYHKGEEHEQPAKPATSGDERGNSHDAVPVKDLAGGTASVAHERKLERAPKHDADHVKEEVEERPEQCRALVECAKALKNKS